MELYFLGTGAGLPSKKRNVTSIALLLLQERGTFWLIDCGEGTQHQMLASPLRPSKLENIFITHLHGDHVYGLPGVLSSRSFQSARSKVAIYGPSGIKEMLTTILETSQAHLTYPLEFHEVNLQGPVFEDDMFRVTCVPLEHNIQSFGYRFEEKPRSGKLLRKKLDALRIPAGPIFKQLKDNQDVCLPNGTILKSNDFVSPPSQGKTVVICGDTMPSSQTCHLAENADVLVHEATYRAQDTARALKHNHSTSIQAAQTAAKSKVKNLILTHISARYDEESCDLLLKEAQSVFSRTFLASDHFRFDLQMHSEPAE